MGYFQQSMDAMAASWLVGPALTRGSQQDSILIRYLQNILGGMDMQRTFYNFFCGELGRSNLGRAREGADHELSLVS